MIHSAIDRADSDAVAAFYAGGWVSLGTPCFCVFPPFLR